jgi:hypothetical protein
MTQQATSEASQLNENQHSHIDPERTVHFQVSFFQYQAGGGFDINAVETLEKATMTFDELCKEHDPRNLIANAIDAFCKNPDALGGVLPIIFGAMYKKLPEKLTEREIHIDLRDLMAMYQIDEQLVIDTFKIFTFQPNQVISLDLQNIDNMPPELQEIAKAAQKAHAEGSGSIGCLSMKSDGSGLELVTKEQYEERFGEGSWEEGIPDAIKQAQTEIQEKAKEQNEAPKPHVHKAPSSVN